MNPTKSAALTAKKKILILLPDGVGLRNFAFTSFVDIGEKMDWEVIFWNHTPFDLSCLSYKEIKLEGRAKAKTDLLKRAKIEAELDHFTRTFKDPVYQTYKFPASQKGIKAQIKNSIIKYLIHSHSSEKGLQELRSKMQASERKGRFYEHCKAVLEEEKPDLVFCTNQRPVNAIAPLTAARDLEIPTATFIFSWDNLPKATMVVDTDHYFVWSAYMAEELLKYYSHIKPQQILITGSPQFEPHSDMSLRQSRQDFFEEHGLDLSKRYICFSGDDNTTCPDDPQYLDDIAESVRQLNNEGRSLGIVFRRCPVDFSNRYDAVLEKHQDIIIPVNPLWKKVGDNWNSILPTINDLALQINTIIHTEAVVNLASSMVFDYGIFDKPCLYLNYKVKNRTDKSWTPQKVYNFVHFRSMPSKKAVFWLNSKDEIPEKLEFALSAKPEDFEETRKWFKKINIHPPQEASQRIWEKIKKIVLK
ncbi:UDP-glycosyltransferase [Salinimicrobium sp. MT39]|uniref:UDP-glycosyltransferase n=1 Tax=Salinimicrobium profundisediminis TaxID=2994553 RepID=A0A9X3CVH5_9FLAO|nr:UDP-glycosyltransferase [Salinimicrobium profundisediminis]MCX2837478.1 UDP-glycosyltransferase [Salinimicrobium profundisediminis]